MNGGGAKQLIILAGGLGTRLKARLGDLPKPMIPIGGRPLLEHQIELAQRHGFTDILIFGFYQTERIQAHFGAGEKWGVSIKYIIEKEPLGTAGAVLAGFDSLAPQFVVLYGDTMVNVDLGRIWKVHHERRADATLLLHPNDHPLDSDLVETDAIGWIRAFHGRPHPQNEFFQNLVNAGLYVVNKEALQVWRTLGPSTRTAPSPLPSPPRVGGRNSAERITSRSTTGLSPKEEREKSAAPPLDFGKDLFPAMLARGGKLFGYNTPEYIKDIGTPDRYDRVCAEFERGVVQRSSLSTPQRAVFIDRDGTVNAEVDGLISPDQLKLLPGTARAIQTLNHHGYRVVLVTNQPVVAKGFCTEADVQKIHNKLETLLGHEHAFLDRIYYCPHHPEKGFPGERPELKIQCSCRKPNPGMVLQAAEELNLDLRASWFIGDTTTDIQTAKNADVRSILVKSGYAGKDGKHNVQPDFTFETLKAAAEWIVTQG